jgi:hypothetical protein
VNALNDKMMLNPFFMMEKLQKFATSGLNPAIIRDKLQTMGLSDNTIAAMMRNSFRPDVFAQAPVLNDNQIGSLNKVDAAYARLGSKIKNAFGQFTAKHGLQIVTDMEKITTAVIKLAEALTNLADKFKLFGMISNFLTSVGDTANNISLLFGSDKDRQKLADKMKKNAAEHTQEMKDGNFFQKSWGIENDEPLMKKLVKPPTRPGLTDLAEDQWSSKTMNVNPTINVYHQGEADPNEVADKTGRDVGKVFRQLQPQMRWN